jgi:hypothetical protein
VAAAAKPRCAGQQIALGVNAKRAMPVDELALDAIAFATGCAAAHGSRA